MKFALNYIFNIVIRLLKFSTILSEKSRFWNTRLKARIPSLIFFYLNNFDLKNAPSRKSYWYYELFNQQSPLNSLQLPSFSLFSFKIFGNVCLPCDDCSGIRFTMPIATNDVADTGSALNRGIFEEWFSRNRSKLAPKLR